MLTIAGILNYTKLHIVHTYMLASLLHKYRVCRVSQIHSTLSLYNHQSLSNGEKRNYKKEDKGWKCVWKEKRPNGILRPEIRLPSVDVYCFFSILMWSVTACIKTQTFPTCMVVWGWIRFWCCLRESENSSKSDESINITFMRHFTITKFSKSRLPFSKKRSRWSQAIISIGDHMTCWNV